MKFYRSYGKTFKRLMFLGAMLVLPLFCHAQYISYYAVSRVIKQISLCLVPIGVFMVFWEMQHGGDVRKTIIKVIGGCLSIVAMYWGFKALFGV